MEKNRQTFWKYLKREKRRRAVNITRRTEKDRDILQEDG
jgi:hypothetical protein